MTLVALNVIDGVVIVNRIGCAERTLVIGSRDFKEEAISSRERDESPLSAVR